MEDNNKNSRNQSGSQSYKCGVTPEMVTSLGPNEIFVFGSNLHGMHMSGAARIALMRFGAKMGHGVGLQGQSYAIPTMQGPVETIRPYVDEFIRFAKESPNKHFLVTKIGCGISGFTIEEIAPLFREAITLSNVSLPQEFIDYILANSALPAHVVRMVHGQTRTLADFLCELDKEHHFKSAEEAVKAVINYVETIRKRPDPMPWTVASRALGILLPKAMTEEGLDTCKLQDLLVDFFKEPCQDLTTVYRSYVIEKTIKIIEMLNEFRRYNDYDDLMFDLRMLRILPNNCGPQFDDYYFGFGSPSGGYIMYFFVTYTQDFWKEHVRNGEFDIEAYKKFMYGDHFRALEKYGLERVIENQYQNDGPCHPEVYFPNPGYAAPVYEEYRMLDAEMHHTQERRYIKSCGEGKGPNCIKDHFEFLKIRRMIERSRKYVLYDKDGEYKKLLVPKDDLTLPLYHYNWGKFLFTTEEAKQQAIRKIWDANPDLFPNHN